MFKSVPMLRLSLLVLELDERAVLRHLGKAEIVQLARTPAGPDTAPLVPLDRGREMARCDRILTRVENLQRSLELTCLPAESVEITERSLEWAENKLDLLEEQAGELLRQNQNLQQHAEELTGTGKVIAAYRGLQIPLGDPDQYSFLHFVTGRLPAGNLEKLELGDDVALLPLPAENGWQPVVVMTTTRRREVLEGALQQAGFQKQTLPIVEGANLDDFTEEQQRDQTKVAAELDDLNSELTVLAAELAQPLAEAKTVASVERRLWEAEENFPRTEKAVLFTGWIPDHEAGALERQLREITDGRCVFKTIAPTQAAKEQVPTLLRHAWPFRPFEMLVSAYGFPEYWEVEPTIFVALSYVLMFGMMFGDVGDGAILVIAGLFALLKAKGKMIRDAGLLLLFNGGSSIIFGAIYGSCFGIPSLKKYALWHDPLEGDTMGFMVTAIEIGIVLMSLGLILNVFNRFCRGDAIGGCLGKFGLAGLLFYWGTLALAVKYAAFQSRGLALIAFVLFFALPLAAWILKEPIEYFRHHSGGRPGDPNHSLQSAIMESMVEVFEGLLSYFSNTISFVRLTAYCMSHAALLMATFIFAANLRHVPYCGGVLSLLAIIFGNLLALVLECIVASVQALRLEYYEFFGKFFVGTGQPFKPFRLSGEQQTATI